MICKKASAGIRAMRRIKPFVPVDMSEKVYKNLVQPYFEHCPPLSFRTTAVNYQKIIYRDFNLVLLGFLLVPVMMFFPLI